MNLENINKEKKYRVFLEMTEMSREGYQFLRPEYSTDFDDKPHFYLTYHFKENGKNNPIIVIDMIDGCEFKEQIQIIQHFKRHHALSFACLIDGIEKITHGNQGI